MPTGTLNFILLTIRVESCHIPVSDVDVKCIPMTRIRLKEVVPYY